jgi:hypothetical protein
MRILHGSCLSHPSNAEVKAQSHAWTPSYMCVCVRERVFWRVQCYSYLHPGKIKHKRIILNLVFTSNIIGLNTCRIV